MYKILILELILVINYSMSKYSSSVASISMNSISNVRNNGKILKNEKKSNATVKFPQDKLKLSVDNDTKHKPGTKSIDAGQRLVEAFRSCFEKVQLVDKVSSHVTHQLLAKTLIITEETSSDLINIYSKFLHKKETIKLLETLIITKSLSKSSDEKKNASSLLQQENGKFLRILFAFISKSVKLNTIMIDSIEINTSLIVLLSKALALTQSKLNVFGIKSVNLGDAGLNILAHGLSRVKMQILALEDCSLTDECLRDIAKILQSQENVMNIEYWNSTLRCGDISKFEVTSETCHILSWGLVGISLSNNQITGNNFHELIHALRENFWLLGLNLSSNTITCANMKSFLEQIAHINNSLQAIILNDNIGYDLEVAKLASTITSNNISKMEYVSPNTKTEFKNWIEMQMRDLIPKQFFDLFEKKTLETKTEFIEEFIPMKEFIGLDDDMNDDLSNDENDYTSDDEFNFGIPSSPERGLESIKSSVGRFSQTLRPPSRDSVRPTHDRVVFTDDLFNPSSSSIKKSITRSDSSGSLVVKKDKKVINNSRTNRNDLTNTRPLSAPSSQRIRQLPEHKNKVTSSLISHSTKHQVPKLTLAKRSKSPPTRVRNNLNSNDSSLRTSKLIPSSRNDIPKSTSANKKKRVSKPEVTHVNQSNDYFEKLSEAIITATNNLAQVSIKLTNVASSFSESFFMHQSQVFSSSKKPLQSSLEKSNRTQEVSSIESNPLFSPLVVPMESSHHIEFHNENQQDIEYEIKNDLHDLELKELIKDVLEKKIKKILSSTIS